MNDIPWRADGVFLWVYIVTNDLKQAAKRHSLEVLRDRLKECPPDMSDLFKHMINKMDSYYVRHPKPYLHLISHDAERNGRFSLIEFMFASLGSETLNGFVRTAFDEKQIISALASKDAFELELIARCAGLVEVNWNSEDMKELPDRGRSLSYTSWRDCASHEVSFIHRTVLDFLHNTAEGRTLLHRDAFPVVEVDKLYLLVQMCMSLYLAENVGLNDMPKTKEIITDMLNDMSLYYATSEYLKATDDKDPWQLLNACFTRLYGIALQRTSELCGPDISFARSSLFGLVDYFAPDLDPGVHLLWHIAMEAEVYFWSRIDSLPREQQLYISYLACLNSGPEFGVPLGAKYYRTCKNVCERFGPLVARKLKVCYRSKGSESVQLFESTFLTYLVWLLLDGRYPARKKETWVRCLPFKLPSFMGRN